MGRKRTLSEEELLQSMLKAMQRAERAVSWIYRWQAPRATLSRLRSMLVESQRSAARRRIGDHIYHLDPEGRYFRPLLHRLATGKREAAEVRQAAEEILRHWPAKDDT